MAEAHAVSPSVVARVQRFWQLLHASDVPESGREAALLPLVFAGLGRRSPRWLLPLKPLDLVLQENYTALKRHSPHKPPNELSEQLRKFVAIRFDMERVSVSFTCTALCAYSIQCASSYSSSSSSCCLFKYISLPFT